MSKESTIDVIGIKMQILTLAESDVKISNNLNRLAKNYVKTNDQVFGLEQKIEELDNISRTFPDELSKTKIQLEAQVKSIEELKDVKSQIFAVMALFFGIFAFLSIDIGVTKSLLTFSDSQDRIMLFTVVGALLVSQIIFFFCLYYFLLVPFLNRTHNKQITSKISYIILFMCGILIGLCVYLSISNSDLQKNQDNLQNQINILNAKTKNLK